MFLHHGGMPRQVRQMAGISHGNTELEGSETLADHLKYRAKLHFLHFKLPLLQTKGKNYKSSHENQGLK